jgi:hypothetical protein
MERYHSPRTATGGIIRDRLNNNQLIAMTPTRKQAADTAQAWNDRDDPQFTPQELSDICRGLMGLARLLDLSKSAGSTSSDEYRRLAVKAASAAFIEIANDA